LKLIAAPSVRALSPAANQLALVCLQVNESALLVQFQYAALLSGLFQERRGEQRYSEYSTTHPKFLIQRRQKPAPFI
jgi:hypothetical protein